MNKVSSADAIALSSEWFDDVDLVGLVGDRLVGLDDGIVDVIAIGKAADEMARAAGRVLGSRVGRRFIVVDAPRKVPDELGCEVWVGDHPVPGPASLEAGERLVAFLDRGSTAGTTLFLVSGGASSLCVRPAPPLTLDDLGEVWRAALRAGFDITALNQLRACTSLISGGAVLRHVRTSSSRTLVMVDNVISGAPWVGSGLTYDYAPSRAEFDRQLSGIGLAATPIDARMLEAFEERDRRMTPPPLGHHLNEVLAEPVLMLELTAAAAARRGLRVVSLGAVVHGDVEEVSRRWAHALADAARTGDPVCVVGVGEVTVRVSGEGRGGRAQEFAWRMAPELARLGRDAVFVARASDGRDFVEGVGGAWVDSLTMSRCERAGLDWSDVARRHDTSRGLEALGQLLEGHHTGWNLCDLYLAVM